MATSPLDPYNVEMQAAMMLAFIKAHEINEEVGFPVSGDSIRTKPKFRAALALVEVGP